MPNSLPRPTLVSPTAKALLFVTPDLLDVTLWNVLKEIYKSGIDVNCQNATGGGALAFAAWKGWVDCLDYLLQDHFCYNSIWIIVYKYIR